MLMLEETKESKLLHKCQTRQEPTFTLRAQDQSSPRTIAFWILENIETAPAEKLEGALADAIAMRRFSPRKAAD